MPDLVPCLLPAGYPAACHRFLRKWLIMPPPYRLADCTHRLCKLLASPHQVRVTLAHADPCNVTIDRLVGKSASDLPSIEKMLSVGDSVG